MLDGLTHGYEFFCGGRVNADGGIEVGFGGSHLERDRHALNNFPPHYLLPYGPPTPIGFGVNDQLHQRLFVLARQCSTSDGRRLR